MEQSKKRTKGVVVDHPNRWSMVLGPWEEPRRDKFKDMARTSEEPFVVTY